MTLLLDKLDDQDKRDWYAATAVERGWSRNVLLNQIMNRLHERGGSAPSNFAGRLPAIDSELAQQLIKDPYIFGFLGLTGRVAERDVEQALMDRLQQTLLEFGRGYSFVGRQVHFDVDGDDFYVDLLLFHIDQLRRICTSHVGATRPVERTPAKILTGRVFSGLPRIRPTLDLGRAPARAARRERDQLDERTSGRSARRRCGS